MKKSVLLIITCFISSQIFSQEANTRPPFELNLAVDEESYFSAQIAESKYILPNNTIQVFPGEEIYIEAELKDNALVNLKRVEEIKDDKKTMVIKFWQEADGRKHKNMMLSVYNPFDKKIKYSAMIYLTKYNRWINTSVVDLQPTILMYELWSDLITSIVLDGFTVVE